jgi:hypothetical protein
MMNNKKMKFSIRNDKMTANNLTWVSQMHIKNTNGIKLNIENFFSSNEGANKRLRVDGLAYNVKRHQRHQEVHRGC